MFTKVNRGQPRLFFVAIVESDWMLAVSEVRPSAGERATRGIEGCGAPQTWRHAVVVTRGNRRDLGPEEEWRWSAAHLLPTGFGKAANIRIVCDLPTKAYDESSVMEPEIRKADRIVFFTKPGLEFHPLTSDELRLIQSDPDLARKTTFVYGALMPEGATNAVPPGVLP